MSAPPPSDAFVWVATYEISYSSSVDEALVPALRAQFLENVVWPANVACFPGSDVVAMSVYTSQAFKPLARALWDAVVLATPEGLNVSLDEPRLC